MTRYVKGCRGLLWLLIFANGALLPLTSFADGLSVTRIENPYVQPLEREIELQMVRYDESDDALAAARYQFEFGYAASDRLLWEVELLAEDSATGDLKLAGYELALKYQLTEQGEFAQDWGVQFEVEKQHSEDVWGLGVTLISAKEVGRFVGLLNLSLEAEFGHDIEDELESVLAAQLRYRYSAQLEPAVEFFQDETGSYLGPTVQGLIRLSRNRKLFWDVGVLQGVSSDAFDTVLRFGLEYEFYAN